MFIRELISNASDALEKLRYQQMTDSEIRDSDVPLEIHIGVDEDKKTFTIQVITTCLFLTDCLLLVDINKFVVKGKHIISCIYIYYTHVHLNSISVSYMVRVSWMLLVFMLKKQTLNKDIKWSLRYRILASVWPRKKWLKTLEQLPNQDLRY